MGTARPGVVFQNSGQPRRKGQNREGISEKRTRRAALALPLRHLDAFDLADQEEVAAEADDGHDRDEDQGGLEISVAGQPAFNVGALAVG